MLLVLHRSRRPAGAPGPLDRRRCGLQRAIPLVVAVQLLVVLLDVVGALAAVRLVLRTRSRGGCDGRLGGGGGKRRRLLLEGERGSSQRNGG